VSAAAQPVSGAPSCVDDGDIRSRSSREFVGAFASSRKAAVAGGTAHAPLPVNATGAGIGSWRIKVVPGRAGRGTTRS
jgi:hypothetical protein